MAGGLSSKVLQLKFMQRAMDKEKRVQEADAPSKDPQDVILESYSYFYRDYKKKICIA